MARNEALKKGGYYPYPPQHLAATASLFLPHPRGGRMLDACAGEGAALAYLAERLGLTPYANELDRDRAAACREKFGSTRVVQGDVLTLRTAHQAFVLNWVNPPYVQNKSGDERRRELEYLKHAWTWTQIGGYTAWVVYHQHMTAEAAAFLLGRSSLLDVYRLPGKHLEAYTQILVVARKAGAERPLTPAAVEAVVSRCQEPDDLPELSVQDKAVYRLPENNQVRRFHFHAHTISGQDMLGALEDYGAQHSTAFRALVSAPPPRPVLTPIVPPRGGQLGLILAAGLFDGLVLDLEEGPAAVRGVVRRVTVNTTPPEMEGIRETYSIRPEVTIALLFRDGQARLLSGSSETALVEFIKTHREALIAYLDEHTRPVYDFKYDHLKPVFERVFRERKLPGRPTSGLFETQKHVVAAAYAALQERRGIIIQGEMGVGKSAIGAALIGALHARGYMAPGQVAVVMYPPHLARKWPREIADAIPGCAIETVKTVDEVTAFMRRAAADPRTLHVLCMSRESAKLGVRRMAA